MMRTLVPALTVFAFASTAAASGPEGYFVTIDDETDQPRGLVQLLLDENGELLGKLRGSFDPSADFSGVCTTCSDDLLNQPLVGLPFVWGLEFDETGKYKKGRIMDPESGKTYKSKVKFSDDFNTLELRGYVGTPMLGRTQTWRRASADDIAAINANLAAYGLDPVE